MITLRNITLRRGREPLLEQANLAVYPGQKIGLVGMNGSGKSSLFALLLGELQADAGDIALPARLAIAHMAQETPALEQAAIDYVLDGDIDLRQVERAMAAAEASGEGRAIAASHARFDAIGGYSARARAGELLAGLGFAAAEQMRPVRDFSGGWRVRLNLARALMHRSDLLLLDEPTNHLDLEAVLWFELWLRAYPGTLMLISHDREFLDAVTDGVVHIEQRQLNYYRGNYSEFERQRTAKLAQQQALHEKQQQEIARLQRFIDRFRAKATKARAAQSRIKALERMERVAPAHVDSPFHFDFLEPPKASNPMLQLDQVTLGYTERTVLTGVHLSLRPDSRIGLLGPNGAGKSTLVRALAGVLAPQGGDLLRSRNLKVGYFAQHQIEQLDAAASPLQHLQRLTPTASVQELRDFLGGFGFSGDQATQACGPLSGGERARLVLALLIWQRPNLLLLDEPTNHLDLAMRHAVIIALQGFAGATVTISHDRHLLNNTVDEYFLVADGSVYRFDGDLDNYRQWLSERRRKRQSNAFDADADKANGALMRKAERRREAQRRAALKPLRDRIEQLLAELQRLSEEMSAIEAELAEPAVYRSEDKQRLTQLLQRQGELRHRQAELESAWADAEEALQAAEPS
ncbi:MAG TPA: ATP-binding cassette domain-containing protein [Nitrococcus sp.]|nr:ATP-binding cassette domain-containing protein [Nitrococcus sp.]